MRLVAVCFVLTFAVPIYAAQPLLSERALKSLTVQVLLDRQNFSPGEIDASLGTNTRRALNAFQKVHNLSATEKGQPDEETLKALEPQPVEIVTEHTITAEEVRGPYIDSIPKDYAEQAKLKSLSYTSPLEDLSERFHSSPDLLKKLNKQTKWKPGETIQVPNVVPNSPEPPGRKAEKRKFKVIVTETTSSLRVEDPAGGILFYAPVTAGSKFDPLPLATWKVVGVSRNPKFHYNPDLFWDAKATDEKQTIAAGPNNAVGVVWIDINAPHYGLHGTPEPSKIGYSESHGCVRLTNWDALRLANLVTVGTAVIFQHDENDQQQEQPPPENQTPSQPKAQPEAQPSPQPQTPPEPQQEPPSKPEPEPQPQTQQPQQTQPEIKAQPPPKSDAVGDFINWLKKLAGAPVKQMNPPIVSQGDVAILKRKKLLLPVKGVALEQLTDSFYDVRGGNRRHEAIDILAPRNTPVLAVEDGKIVRLWLSVPGGITIYQFDPTETYAYYYAHLERYADQLKEGTWVHRGQVLGYVGTSGNAPPNTPHLHFTIFKLTPEKHWWVGQAINPYAVFKG